MLVPFAILVHDDDDDDDDDDEEEEEEESLAESCASTSQALMVSPSVWSCK